MIILRRRRRRLIILEEEEEEEIESDKICSEKFGKVLNNCKKAQAYFKAGKSKKEITKLIPCSMNYLNQLLSGRLG